MSGFRLRGHFRFRPVGDLRRVGYRGAAMSTNVLPFAMAALCFFAAMYACIRANAVVFEVVRAINQQASPQDQEALYVWYPSKWERVTTKYKVLFPEGKLLKKFWVCTAFGAIGMVGVLVSLASGGH